MRPGSVALIQTTSTACGWSSSLVSVTPMRLRKWYVKRPSSVAQTSKRLELTITRLGVTTFSDSGQWNG